jgi:hypothetical protein
LPKLKIAGDIMSHRTELKKLSAELHQLTAHDSIIEAAAIASYPPGTTPDPLPPNSSAEVIAFREMLVAMDSATCPDPPPEKTIEV